MAGSDPKFLKKYLKKTPKKVAYSFRIKEDVLNEFKQYTKLNNINAPDLVNEILEEFLKDKTVYNDYLKTQESKYITIPNIDCIEYNEDINNYTTASNNKSDFIGVEYVINKIPNNLDIWQGLEGYKPANEKYKHMGLEFVIIPEIINKYSDFWEWDIIEKTLYCFYFIVQEDNAVKISLINNMEGINKIKESEDIETLNKVLQMKKELNELKENIEKEISEISFRGGDYSGIEEWAYNKVTEIANKYNTKNIIPMNEKIKENEYKTVLNDKPELIDIINKQQKEIEDLKADLKTFDIFKKKADTLLKKLDPERVEDILNDD